MTRFSVFKILPHDDADIREACMNVLVTGASGAVGPCVVQALCKAGHAVRTFSLDRPHGGPSYAQALRRASDGLKQAVGRRL